MLSRSISTDLTIRAGRTGAQLGSSIGVCPTAVDDIHPKRRSLSVSFPAHPWVHPCSSSLFLSHPQAEASGTAEPVQS